jgi:4-amino-4-deoxy-L-arabinose transferase-like glycosyltransferase
MTSSKVRTSVILALFVVFVGMRLVHLSADPPDNLSIESCSEYGDPGNYAYNARNKVVLGDSKIDELGAAPFAPIPHAVTYASFRLFGVGLLQMNLVPLFFAILLWLVLMRLAADFFPEAGLPFFIMLALNYPFGIFARINDQVMPMTLFVVAGLWFFLKAWDKPARFFPAAILFGLAVLSKGKIIYFHLGVLPPAFLLILAERGELRSFKLNARRLAWFFGGALLVFVPWFVGIYLRYPTVFRNMGTDNAKSMLPGNLGQLVSFWASKPAFSFFPTNRPLTYILFFYILALLLVVCGKAVRARLSPLEIVCVVWTVVGLAVHSCIGYRPIRHYIEFTIPIMILVSLFCVRLLAGFRLDVGLKRRAWFAAGLFFLVYGAATSFARKYIPVFDVENRKGGIILMTLLAAVVVSAVLYLLVNRFLNGKALRVPRKAAAAVFLLAGLFYAYRNVGTYLAWVSDPTFNLKMIGRDLGRAFPGGSFSGLLVPSLSLENRNPAHTSFRDYANFDPGFLKRVGVTHIFTGSFNDETRYYEETFPEEMERARILVRYRIWRSWFYLIDIRDHQPPTPPASVHEAEIMVREAGFPFFDPAASGGFAVRVESGTPALVGMEEIQSPAPATPFRGKIVLKPLSPGPGRPVVAVRVVRGDLVPFERKFVLPAASPKGGYLEFPFTGSFGSDGPYFLEIRASGLGLFAFDKIEIVY